VPLGTVYPKFEVYLIVGTYLFPLAMFFLAFATQYFSDLNSDFWFKESKQATTTGFPTTCIVSKILHFCSFSHAYPTFQAPWLLVLLGKQSSTHSPDIPDLKVRGFTAAFR
jgi:hypothetical protein